MLLRSLLKIQHVKFTCSEISFFHPFLFTIESDKQSYRQFSFSTEVYQEFSDIFYHYGTVLLSTMSHSDRFFRNNSVHLFKADFREGWIVPDGQWGKKGKTLLSTINLDKPLSLSPAVFSNHCLLYKYGSYHSSNLSPPSSVPQCETIGQ